MLLPTRTTSGRGRRRVGKRDELGLAGNAGKLALRQSREACSMRSLQDHLGARLEYDQLVLREAPRLTFDFDLAAEHVGGALDVLRAHLEAGAGN
jgi:hypothetical protein